MPEAGAAKRAALNPLPYTLVEIEEPEKGPIERVREADSLQWKLWIVQYAWLISLLTVAPGVALITFTVTRDMLFSLGVTAAFAFIPGAVFWWRTKGLT